MTLKTTRRSRLARWALVCLCTAVGCGDDGVAVTEGASSTGTGTTEGAVTDTPTTTPTTVPTTTEPATDSGMTDGTDSATTVPTTSGTTVGVDTDTGTSTSTGDSSTGDTTGDTTTDTTGGSEVVGRSVSQTVNSGHVVASDNFRMVFTLGQPTANQSTTTSPNFKLHGGLVGANGSPP